MSAVEPSACCGDGKILRSYAWDSLNKIILFPLLFINISWLGFLFDNWYRNIGIYNTSNTLHWSLRSLSVMITAIDIAMNLYSRLGCWLIFCGLIVVQRNITILRFIPKNVWSSLMPQWWFVSCTDRIIQWVYKQYRLVSPFLFYAFDLASTTKSKNPLHHRLFLVSSSEIRWLVSQMF